MALNDFKFGFVSKKRRSAIGIDYSVFQNRLLAKAKLFSENGFWASLDAGYHSSAAPFVKHFISER